MSKVFDWFLCAHKMCKFDPVVHAASHCYGMWCLALPSMVLGFWCPALGFFISAAAARIALAVVIMLSKCCAFCSGSRKEWTREHARNPHDRFLQKLNRHGISLLFNEFSCLLPDPCKICGSSPSVCFAFVWDAREDDRPFRL